MFRTYEQNGHITVLPSDAEAQVAQGRLDRSLFDVTALAAQEYDTAHTDTLPLIISGAGSTAQRRLTAYAADGNATRDLDSINALAVRVPGDDLGVFWKQLVPQSARLTAEPIAHVWLDGRVRADLDRSTAQIGAPAVWQTGDQGQGVKVAILDTGADAHHPDLAGRIAEAKDFSGSTSTGDAFGHGTHVASIVGGSGAASGGTRKGVAPQADLLIGKVLGDDGQGSESQVIEGMQWAVEQGARVVNMSLGDDTSRTGDDPLSIALNDLSRTTGTLFVVAAGNIGEQGAGTVGSPGAADEALTVGAVDRDDTLALFSSRGPRPSDGAVKPDITAPGVGIVAARAAGTTMGDPVDDNYTAASGTSMATPHVAGAAALLVSRHPDWNGSRVKDALISTAHTVAGQPVTHQGAGRTDIAAAVQSPVTATGSLHLGSAVTGADDIRHSVVRYTNTSASDITLSGVVALATTEGRAAPAGTVRLSAPSVRVPAHGTAEVTVTVDVGRVPRGRYYGYLTATSSDHAIAVHTTLALDVHSPVHRLTVVTRDIDGTTIPAHPTIWGADGFVQYDDSEAAIAEVEEGTYQVDYGTVRAAGDGQELRQAILPEVKVTRDTTVTLDLRDTHPVEIRTPRPAEQRGILSYQTYRRIDGNALVAGTMYFDNAKQLYVSPTATVTDGTFEFASRWQLVAPLLTAQVAGTEERPLTYYMPSSPLLPDHGATLTAVDAGDAADPHFEKARGRLAVLTNKEMTDESKVAEQAAAAGAKALLVVFFDSDGWTRWRPTGDRWALPTLRVGAGTGARLLERVHVRTTRLAFTGTARSPYLYDVMQVAQQGIPRQVIYTVSARNSAVIRTTYADNGGSGWASEQRFGWRPYQDTAWNQYSRYVPTGFSRTEYVSSGDTLWQHLVHHTTFSDIDTPLFVGMRDFPRTYRAGTAAPERWQQAVVRPSIPVGTTTPTDRAGDVLRLRVPEFTDSQPGHWSLRLGGDTARGELTREGKPLAVLDGGMGDVAVPSGAADYRFDLTTTRSSDAWRFATETDTSWTFRSASPNGAAVPLPLLQLDYAVPVDADNTVRTRGRHDITVTVRNQDGLATPRGLSAQVETSFDDGHSWRRLDVHDAGGTVFRAGVPYPGHVHTDVYVTLRVTVRDATGASVRQTVRRAYRISG
ncbi:S8 family peptidase [Streptomyces sp. NPDC002740]